LFEHRGGESVNESALRLTDFVKTFTAHSLAGCAVESVALSPVRSSCAGRFLLLWMLLLLLSRVLVLVCTRTLPSIPSITTSVTFDPPLSPVSSEPLITRPRCDSNSSSSFCEQGFEKLRELGFGGRMALRSLVRQCGALSAPVVQHPRNLFIILYLS